MYRCSKCGNKIQETEKFCGKCGAKVEFDIVNTENKVKSSSGSSKKYALIIVGAFIVVAAIVIGFFILNKKSGISTDISEDICESETIKSTEFVYDNDEEAIESIATTQLSAFSPHEEKYIPNTRDYSLHWDTTLFDTLEDINVNSVNDGMIVHYKVEKKQLINSETGNLVEYWLYHNPINTNIEKIVSMENKDGQLLLTDYYFDNGKINFIFQRMDTVYTPTYATLHKTGIRYAFNNDTLVLLRRVTEPLAVNDYVLSLDGGNNETEYNKLSQDDKNEYDRVEKSLLNEAYNTWNAVTTMSGVVTIQGYIVDENNKSMSGIGVTFCSSKLGNDSGIKSVTTGKDGFYSIDVSLGLSDCYFKIKKDGYNTETIYNVSFAENDLKILQKTVHLISDSQKKINVEINLSSILNSDLKTVISGTKLKVRPGVNNKTGTVVAEGETSESGVFNVELMPGEYTIESEKDGYYSTFSNVTFTSSKLSNQIELMPLVQDSDVKVVLEWDSNTEIDLDACIFTPQQGSNGDMQYVNASKTSDGIGTILSGDVSSTHGLEVISIAQLQAGKYSFYVTNSSEIQNGQLDSNIYVNIKVYIYNKQGLLRVFDIPYSNGTCVWEVFELNGYEVTSSQHKYDTVEGKDWFGNKNAISED